MECPEMPLSYVSGAMKARHPPGIRIRNLRGKRGILKDYEPGWTLNGAVELIAERDCCVATK
jgi:hypothetical protein